MGYTHGTKWTYELVKEFVESLGYILISTKYINNITEIIIKDKEGYLYNTKLITIIQNYIPHMVSTSNNFSISNIKLWIKKNNLNYNILNTEYKLAQQKLLLIDSNGYYFTPTWTTLQKNKIPLIFDKSNSYTIQNIKLWCKMNNKPFELISEIYEGAIKKLQWQCLENNCMEIFLSSWNAISSGHGCGYCKGMQIGLSNCLATKNSDLATEWHPIKNGNLTPYDIAPNRNKEVWWQCLKNSKHEWCATPNNRNNRNQGCPFCSGRYATEENNLLLINPILCKEWHYGKNDRIPEEYTPGSSQKVWWKCKDEHEWEASICNRNKDVGCPYCSGLYPSENNNLLIDNSILCEEWDYEKNDKLPNEYTPNSGQYVWWKCKECGNKWRASIDSRNKKDNKGSNCPKCNEFKGEMKISEVLKVYNIYDISQHIFNDCRNIRPLKFDHYLPNHNTCIEYQGIQHYEPVDFAGKGEEWALKEFEENQIKDQIKRDYCKNNNIKLLEICYKDFDNIEQILDKELNLNMKLVI
jgi:hypothetical protein